MAVQDAVVEAVPAVGLQVTALDKLFEPFLNCTVPVGPAPWTVVETNAVSVTLAPAEIVVALEVTAIVVAVPVIEVMVNDTPDELLGL